jgi:hypothetical protein
MTLRAHWRCMKDALVGFFVRVTGFYIFLRGTFFTAPQAAIGLS